MVIDPGARDTLFGNALSGRDGSKKKRGEGKEVREVGLGRPYCVVLID